MEVVVFEVAVFGDYLEGHASEGYAFDALAVLDCVEIEAVYFVLEARRASILDRIECEVVLFIRPIAAKTASDLPIDIVGLYDTLQTRNILESSERLHRVPFEVIALLDCYLLRLFADPCPQHAFHSQSATVLHKRMVKRSSCLHCHPTFFINF